MRAVWYHLVMNKHLPKKAKDIKGSVAIAELCRAHYIIALLALSFSATIVFTTVYQVQFDAALGAVASMLLVLVAAVSLATVYALRNR